MRKKINYTMFHCGTCDIEHYQYWIDGGETNLTGKEAQELLDSGDYYLSPVVPINNIRF